MCEPRCINSVDRWAVDLLVRGSRPHARPRCLEHSAPHASERNKSSICDGKLRAPLQLLRAKSVAAACTLPRARAVCCLPELTRSTPAQRTLLQQLRLRKGHSARCIGRCIGLRSAGWQLHCRASDDGEQFLNCSCKALSAPRAHTQPYQAYLVWLSTGLDEIVLNFRTGEFFQVPTVGFTTSKYHSTTALCMGYCTTVLRFFAYIQKFREKNSPKFCMQPAGGHHTAKNNGKMVPLSFYHRVFRSPIKFLPDIQGKKRHRY
eukprot:SAG11_NODE_1030_length_6119_cov_7.559302_5_plen_262_part_00